MHLINLRLIVQNSLAPLTELLSQKNTSITNNIDKSFIVQSDEFMLSTIFRNLIFDAIKFSHPEGSIIINTVDSGKESENEITVCVEDSGVGISKERIHELFDSDVNKSTVGTDNE